MANHIEIRHVEVRQPVDGGYVTIQTRYQYRTKDITAAVPGEIPIESEWSDWTELSVSSVFIDEHGNPIE